MKEKYIPGEGCECLAYNEYECGCDADWTPREVYELREQRDRLAEALRSIRGYWNRNQNESAMVDACWHAIYTAEQALAAVEGGSHDN